MNVSFICYYCQVTRDHCIVPLEEPDTQEDNLKKPEAGDLPSSDDKEWFCEKHTSEKVTCICVQCVLPLCPFCISDILTQKSHKHKKHDIVGESESQLENFQPNEIC